MQKVKWGIIGCGTIAPNHSEAITSSEYAELVAVCDIDEAKGKAFAANYNVAYYKDYKEMMEKGGIEVVSLCTPSGLHSQMAIDAANHGLNILCEKPMGITIPQINAMIDAVNKNGVKMEVIFQRRTSPVSQKTREAVQSGLLGKMVLGDAYLKYYRSPAYYKSADWRATWALDGGGSLMNQGVHGIDLLCWIMDSPVKSVFAKAEAKVRDIEVEDTAVALIVFENGAYGVIEGTTSCNPGELTSFAFQGEKGTIKFNDRGMEMWAVSESKEVVAENDPAMVGGAEGATKSASDPAAIGRSGHKFQVDDLALAIRENRKPFVIGEEARGAVELILAIYESARTGKEVIMKDFLKR